MCVCCPVGHRNDKIKGKGIRHTKKICVALGYTSITGHNKQHETGTTNQINDFVQRLQSGSEDDVVPCLPVHASKTTMPIKACAEQLWPMFIGLKITCYNRNPN